MILVKLALRFVQSSFGYLYHFLTSSVHTGQTTSRFKDFAGRAEQILVLPLHRRTKSVSGVCNMATATMKAVVLYQPGGPDALKIEQCPIPKASKGQVLIQVKAFGLNRSELFTRPGLSPNVNLPRILGVEAVGLVHQAPGGEFPSGQVVPSCMGGLGREVYTLIKAEYARPIETKVR
jgi:hypothetical protein